MPCAPILLGRSHALIAKYTQELAKPKRWFFLWTAGQILSHRSIRIHKCANRVGELIFRTPWLAMTTIVVELKDSFAN